MKKNISIVFTTMMALFIISSQVMASTYVLFNFTFDGWADKTITGYQEFSGTGKITFNPKDKTTFQIADYTSTVGGTGKAIKILHSGSTGTGNAVILADSAKTQTMKMGIDLYLPTTKIPKIFMFGLNNYGPALGILGNGSSDLYIGNGQWGFDTSDSIATLATGQWNRIEIQCTPILGIMDVYINGDLIRSGVTMNKDATVLGNIKTKAEAKAISTAYFHFNNYDGATDTADCYVDNIKIENMDFMSIGGQISVTPDNPVLFYNIIPGINGLNTDNFTFKNENLNISFKPVSVTMVSANYYTFTLPKDMIKANTNYSLNVLNQSVSLNQSMSFSIGSICNAPNTVFVDEFNRSDVTDITGLANLASIASNKDKGNIAIDSVNKNITLTANTANKDNQPNLQYNLKSPFASKFVIEMDITATTSSSRKCIYTKDSASIDTVLLGMFENGYICTANTGWGANEQIAPYKAGTKYHVKLVVNWTNKTEDIYIDGVLVGSNKPFMYSGSTSTPAPYFVRFVIYGVSTTALPSTGDAMILDNINTANYTVAETPFDINKVVYQQGTTIIKNFANLVVDVPLTANVTISNPQNGIVIVATHEGDKLISISYQNTSSGTATYSFDDVYIANDNYTNRYVKVFLWKGIDNILPCTEAVPFYGKD